MQVVFGCAGGREWVNILESHFTGKGMDALIPQQDFGRSFAIQGDKHYLTLIFKSGRVVKVGGTAVGEVLRPPPLAVAA